MDFEIVEESLPEIKTVKELIFLLEKMPPETELAVRNAPLARFSRYSLNGKSYLEISVKQTERKG